MLKRFSLWRERFWCQNLSAQALSAPTQIYIRSQMRRALLPKTGQATINDGRDASDNATGVEGSSSRLLQ